MKSNIKHIINATYWRVKIMKLTYISCFFFQVVDRHKLLMEGEGNLTKKCVTIIKCWVCN